MVFEAVFQNPGLQDTVAELTQYGYYTTMYHLLLPDYGKSQAHVAGRYLKGGMHIDKETVFENYYENLKNVASCIYLFNKAYFIDATLPAKHPNRLAGTFINGELKQYQNNKTFNGLLSYAANQFFIRPETLKVVDAGVPFIDASAFKGITSNTLELNV